MSKILTNLSFLEKGKPFPPAAEFDRLERYKNNRLLFEDEHAEVYKEQFKRIERVIGNFNDIVSYGVVFNYQKLMSLKIADFVFGTPPGITASDDKKQSVIEKIIFDTDFFNKLYMSVIDISRYGDSILQVSEKNNKARLDVTSPKYWFPVVNNDNIKEFASYVWDTDKSKSTGVDTVLKQNDHAMDDIRYFCYTILKGEDGMPSVLNFGR